MIKHLYSLKQSVTKLAAAPLYFSSLILCTTTLANETDFSSLLSLIDYAQSKGSPANSSWGKSTERQKFPAGYQTIKIHNTILNGCRDPFKRLSSVPYDFTSKTVLDIGTNQGGMLFALADKIAWGVGIDYDANYINVANKIKSLQPYHNIDFYTFDVDHNDILRLPNLMPNKQVDICFLLSICCWISKWRELVDLVYSISNALLLEANGSEKSQQSLLSYVQSKYKTVIEISENSSDEEVPPKVPRRLYLCSK